MEMQVAVDSQLPQMDALAAEVVQAPPEVEHQELQMQQALLEMVVLDCHSV
jgi:hypothetical protein